MPSWFDRRDDVDEFALADLDELTEQLLTLVRPVTPDQLTICSVCLEDLVPGDSFCSWCSTVQKGRRAA